MPIRQLPAMIKDHKIEALIGWSALSKAHKTERISGKEAHKTELDRVGQISSKDQLRINRKRVRIVAGIFVQNFMALKWGVWLCWKPVFP